MTQPVSPEMRVASAGDPEHEQLYHLVEYMRSAMALLPGQRDDPNHLGMLMTAACMYAGTLLGVMIVAGLAGEKDKRRIINSMTHNFRQGIEIGRRAATRAAVDDVAGHA